MEAWSQSNIPTQRVTQSQVHYPRRIPKCGQGQMRHSQSPEKWGRRGRPNKLLNVRRVIVCEAAVTLSCPVLQLIDFLRRARLQPYAVQSFLTFPSFHLFLHEPGEYQKIYIFNICPYFKKSSKKLCTSDTCSWSAWKSAWSAGLIKSLTFLGIFWCFPSPWN